MKKILVTGAGGFIGKHLVNDLSRYGYCVTGLVREAGTVSLPCPVVEADLAESINVPWCGDIIIHAAGRIPVAGVTAREYKRDNIDAMERLLDFAKARNVKLVVFLSTTDVYGRKNRKVLDENTEKVLDENTEKVLDENTEKVLDENTEKVLDENTEKVLDENTEYGISKYYAERLLKENGVVNYVILRLPGIFGKGAGNTWLARAIDNLAQNKAVEVYSADFASNNFLAVEDLARFIRTIISRVICNDIFILGNEERVRIIDMVNFLKNEMRSRSKIVVKESNIVPFSINVDHAVEAGFSSTGFHTMARRFLAEK